MSNFEATKLYESVIEEVISDSRQDFEDSGIDESTLQELRKIWCQKLSQSSVAKFSWDEEANREEEEIARQHREEQLQLQQQAQQVNDPQQPIQALQVQSDLISNGLELPISADGGLSYNSTTSVPNASVTKLEDEDNGGLMLPRIGQSDGTIEFTMYSGDAQKLMNKLKKKEQRQQQRKKKIGQADGDFDDDDDDDIFNDSDDINSDLDDDVESDKEDDEDGQDEGQIMLCLYDKVQRVKNKWKSTLKEGVANINGRDYVFQKSNGESEW